ncbi:5-formyltetrahydrofolate cyclo-ligase [Staphylococcus intermedius]|uniref:5-formyltetrahydrofolate cyclo-ligase n=1 Tax=Staphylococcus intermedius NCTC 11048 TaxID=1141106 RepID=A0A380G6G9_STAIN|nr:5-formyltetrahydrofolate cyclo-ligase [Staphylococcus intermedius]PCF64818.1 5-formyltetrahydrofolate cyclo-ligase [Staphylococcus intermedius]PCF80428.1 5-formyltetrahydrofolate cyclo-ligase [Staphylococcus intermedius]PCF81778.1 5-formyltetrahydrofolate cyclo-ligase [Staphylococcus intermedius]PCF88115.1 5-formyltetrahydrofolate cyclo-ligase [Staphylococcus intermedius]PCF88829.1 5-formyltetrahydrofolate cyclo-ligase [Staphylococcus intermedius]
MTKKALRQATLQKMKMLQTEQKKKADRWLFEQLIQHPKYQQAKHLGLVLSMSHEVETDPIIRHAIKEGKQVYVPTTDYEQKAMVFQQFTTFDQLATDDKGIRYIQVESPVKNNLDLVIVPGVVFNNEGYRIGYGGGYFDRYLSTYEPTNLSLIYDIQLSEIANIEPHDYPVSELIIAKT